MINKPTDPRPEWNPAEVDVEVPDSAKQNLGFIFKEKLGSKLVNWFFKRFSTWLDWLVAIVDARETVENVTMDFTTDGFDAIQEFFNNLRHNDLDINITGFYTDTTKTLILENITGNGTIRFTDGRVFVGQIVINNVFQSSVTFNNSYGFVTTQSEQYGVRITNSSYIYFGLLTTNFGSAPSSDWEMLSVYNSTVTVGELIVNGEFTSDSTPMHLVTISNNSTFEVETSNTLTTNATAGTAIGRSMIKVDESSFFDVSVTPTFQSTWYTNFACQIEMVRYPKADFDIYINHTEGIDYVKEILAGVKEINCTLKTRSSDYSGISDLEMKNITGTGTIYFLASQWVLGNIVENCSCNVVFDTAYVYDSATVGTYSISVKNSSDVYFFNEVLLETTTNGYGGIKIENSKARFDTINYLTETLARYTYLTIDKNSQVYIKKIISGNTVVAYSAFIKILGGSYLHLKEWVASGTTSALKTKDIEGGSYVLAYGNTAAAYVFFTDTASCVIVELP